MAAIALAEGAATADSERTEPVTLGEEVIEPGEDLDLSGYTATTRKDRLLPGRSATSTQLMFPAARLPVRPSCRRSTRWLRHFRSANAYVTMMSTQGTTFHIVGPTTRAAWVYTRDRKKGMLVKLDYMNPSVKFAC